MKFVPPRPDLEKVQRVPHAVASRQGLEAMDRNERTSDFPRGVMADLRRLLTPYLFRAYPEPEPLYQKLAAWLELPREQILLTAAADGGLRSIFDTFIQPGDEVVSVSPSYAMIPVYCGLTGAVLHAAPFEPDLSLPIEPILERIGSRTKLVLLANPNQPIERVYDESELRTLLDACERTGALLVMDEAYHHFCPVSAVSFLSKSRNLVVVRTFSKAFGIAGLRIGYLLSRPENIAHLNKVRPMYETHSFAIAVALYLLDHPGLVHSYVAEVRESLEFLRHGLQGFGFKPHGRWANSLLLSLPAGLSAPRIGAALREKGFCVRVDATPPLSNHLRITVGPMEQTQRFLHTLELILEKSPCL